MRKLLVLAVATTTFLGVACSDDDPGPTATGTPTTAPPGPTSTTFAVDIDLKGDATNGNASALKFFPATLTVHAGDTLAFHNNAGGEPHSVSAGSLVDTAIADLAGAASASPDAAPPASFTKLPNMLPDGQPDTDLSGANPCYLTTGEPVKNTRCAEVQQPPFNGKQTYYSSGWLADGSDFTVPIDAATPAGSYTFYCNLHGPDMSTKVTVVATGQPADTKAAADSRRTSEQQALLAKITPVVAQLATGTAAHAVAGLFIDENTPAQINAFTPNITVAAGGKVSWMVIGPHSIAFNTPATAATLRVVNADGSIHINAAGAAPAGGPGSPGPPAEKPTTVNGGSFDGSGFRNSGIFLSFPPNFYTFTLTFTKAGTFPYLCTVHPAMAATVTVT